MWSTRPVLLALTLGLVVAGAPSAFARDRAPGEGKEGDPSWNKYMEEKGAIDEGLPPWMTKGEEIRLAVVDNLLDQGQTGSALEILAQMRLEGLDGPEVDLRQGMALRLDGVTTEAERLLELAQKRMKGDPRPSAELCILFADLQRIDEAIEECRTATRADDADAGTWNNLGFLLLSAGRAEEALEAAETAVRLDGGEARFRNNLGLAQATLGRENDAFRTLGSTMPKADAAYMVGLTVERRDGAAAASGWFDRALEIDPDHAPTVEHLAAARDPSSSPNPDPGTAGESAGAAPAGSEEP